MWSVSLLALLVRSDDPITESDVDYVVELTDATFEHQTQANSGMTTGTWFVMIHAPWCGHCKNALPKLETLSKLVEDENDKTALNANVAKVDATANSGVRSQFGVKGYPTFIFLKDSKLYTYKGQRAPEAMLEYIKEGHKKDTPLPMPLPKTFFTAIRDELNDELSQLSQAAYIAIMAIWACLVLLVIFLIFAGLYLLCARRRDGPEKKEN